MKNALKKSAFIIIIMCLFTILFSSQVFAEDEAEDEETYEDSIYTIEDIIFNKVPLFDINFFSDKAGGETVTEGSVVHTIRKAVSIWYVSFRNLVIIALAILIIYTGIRMAISTIPSGKAQYKRMLIGWVQSLVIVLGIHYIMILVININNEFVGLVEQAMSGTEGEEYSIYETIRTRAYDFRLSIGFPGMILYITLIIIWVRFIWIYIKRVFTVLILVVIAPFIGAKYAIDSSSGKKGSSFTSWLYDFVMNVLLQLVHAIVYVALVGTSLQLSKQSILGFIVSLVFLNFMLKADEIFRNIFYFDRSKMSNDTAKQQGFKEVVEDLAGITFISQMAKGTYGLGKYAILGATGLGKGTYKVITRVNPHIKDRVNNFLDEQDRRIERIFDPRKNKKGNELRNDFNNMMNNKFKIRRLSRQKGSKGIRAKQLKAKLKAQRKSRYTSNFKFVKDAVVGGGSLFLAIPMAVVNPTAGVAMFAKGVSSLKNVPKKKNTDVKKSKNPLRGYRKLGIYKVYYANKKAKEKYIKKRDTIYKTIQNINDINEIDEKEEKIKNKFNDIKTEKGATDKEINRFKDTTSTLLVEANLSKITSIIDTYVENKNITSIDNSTIDDIIKAVVSELGNNIRLSASARQEIESKAKSAILNKKAKDRRTRMKSKNNSDNSKGNTDKFNKHQIARAISNSVTDKTVNKKFADVAKDIIALENKVKRTANIDKKRANKFLDNL